MTFDDNHGQVVLFGGDNPAPDTWLLQSDRWVQAHPAQSPPAMGDALMATDAATGMILLVGTDQALGGPVQTWSWNGATWSHLGDLPTSAGLRDPVTLAPDADRGGFLLLTWESAPGTPGPPVGTHTWKWADGRWTLETAADLPVGGDRPVFASDPLRHQVVAVLGGLNASADQSAQTWVWRGQDWFLVGPAGLTHYDPLTATASYNPLDGDVLLYMNDARGETWDWDGFKWRLLDTASPAVDTYYRGAQIVADINGQRAVLIASGGRPNRFDTIWVFTGRGWAAAIALP
jgi:hypothetical protein